MLKHVAVGENTVETTYNGFPTGALLLFDALLAVSQLENASMFFFQY